jgi:hypothetical protein
MELCEPTEMASPLQGGGVAIAGGMVYFITCTIRDNAAQWSSVSRI